MNYRNFKPIAVKGDSTFGGIEILKIVYGIEDYVIVRNNYGKPQSARKVKIRYAQNGEASFIFNGFKRVP